MKNSYCIYKHTSPNGKVYIGQTCKKPEKRWRNGYGYKNQPYFYRAIQKYGWENFKHEILFSGLSFEEANKKEIEMISFYNSSDYKLGYNISLGGKGTLGANLSEDTKLKISNSHKGKKRSEESKLRQSKTMIGHACSEDTRKKIGYANSQRVWSDDSKEKLRKANIGKVLSEDIKHKISDSLKGRLVSGKNRKAISESNRKRIWSQESRKKSSDSHKGQIAVNRKPVLCIETGVIYSSAKEASECNNIHRSSISRVCENKGKTAGGYHWQFFNSDANLDR